MGEDIQSRAAEWMKKVLTVGVGTYFLTEESLRHLASEFKLPKELWTAIFESANKSKTEFLKSLSREIMEHFTDKIDPVQFIQEFLKKNEIDLQIKVSFSPKKEK